MPGDKGIPMKINTAALIRFILLGLILPVILSIMVYTGFSTNYTTEVFSKQSFENQYQSGVYRYRILGRAMLLGTYDLIKYYELPTVEAPYALNLLDPYGNEQFYSAYLYMNTFFLSLASMVLFFILNEHRRSEEFVMTDMSLLFICFVMVVTQYAVVPYDTLSYFLLAISILLIIHDNKKLWNLVILCVVVILATLTRETAFFILVFYVVNNYDAIQMKPIGVKINREQVTLLMISICFMFSYLGLRLALGYRDAMVHSFSNGFRLIDNINSIYSIFGTLFFLSIATLFFTTKAVTKEMVIFLKVSSPYILLVWLSANPWEIRLWTPLILILVVMKVRASQFLAMPGQASVSH
jgi:hypothetical protein